MKTVQFITKHSVIMYLLGGILVFGWFATIARGAPRVVGGHDAPNHKYPHIVSLRDLSDNSHLCGGSILNEYWILTAAHCVADQQTNGYKISVGTNYLNESGDVYLPEFTIVHENYESFWYHDIALIRVAGTIHFRKNVQPIKLTKVDFENYNHQATFAGWGSARYGGSMTKSLQEIFLKVIDMEKCKRYHNRVDESHLCSFTRVNEGACMGDSGGPLLVDGVQVGIASYVTPCGIGQPDVFTRVYAYNDWIDNTMELISPPLSIR